MSILKKKKQHERELEHFLPTSLLRGRFFAGANFHNSNELQLLTPARLGPIYHLYYLDNVENNLFRVFISKTMSCYNSQQSQKAPQSHVWGINCNLLRFPSCVINNTELIITQREREALFILFFCFRGKNLGSRFCHDFIALFSVLQVSFFVLIDCNDFCKRNKFYFHGSTEPGR